MSTGSSPRSITPIAAPSTLAEPFEQFSARIRREFIEGSAIAPALFATTVRLVTDTEPQPGGEVSYPIHEALGWHLSRFGLQARATLYGALLLQEDGSVRQAKLNRARRDREKGKEIKYEYPVGATVRAFLPTVPTEIRQAIAERYRVEVPQTGSFWSWLYEHPEITVILTEGAKKALSLLSLGYVAIALVGVNGGYRLLDDGRRELIPDLQQLAGGGRQITLAFDQDSKPQTRFKVGIALSRLGELVVAAGSTVAIASWGPEQGKGVDDLIVNCGSSAWAAAAAAAAPLQEWETSQGKGFGQTPAAERQRVIARRAFRFQQYLETLRHDFELTEAEERKIEWYEGYAPVLPLKDYLAKGIRTTLLRGWLGAGKTEAILRSIIALAERCPIVVVAPLNGLLRQTLSRAAKIANLLGQNVGLYHYQDDVTTYRDQIRTEQPGLYFMCPDSLKSYSTGELQSWQNTIVVIDEFQGIRKEVQQKSASFPEFERMLQQCQHLIAADAFLSNADVRILSRYRPGQRIILSQRQQKSQQRISWIEKRNQQGAIALSHEGVALEVLNGWIKQGIRRIAVVTDAIAVAKMIALRLVQRSFRVRLICSETPEQNHDFLPDPDAERALIRLLSSQRLERLKWWVIASEGTEQDDQNLLDSLIHHFTSPNSAKLRAYRNLRLFRELKLQRLAQVSRTTAAKAHLTHFNADSPIVQQLLWPRFQQSNELRELFPQVQTATDFWAIVRQCMTFLGYESAGQSIRVETEELHPNGKDRQGRQRWVRSQSRYFSAWVRMEESGNLLFGELFETLIKALRERIAIERERFKRKELDTVQP